MAPTLAVCISSSNFLSLATLAECCQNTDFRAVRCGFAAILLIEQQFRASALQIAPARDSPGSRFFPKPPRENCPVTFVWATYWHLPGGTCHDFDTVDGFRSLSRDGDRLRAWPDLANPV
jgi:hypothetical protein